MDNNVLTKRRGFSLAELSLVLMLAGVFVAAAFYSAAKIRQIAQAERVIAELDSIALASTRYYSEHGAWPAALADLRPSYLAQQSSDVNPFGNAYAISSNTSSVSISTLLPKGLITSKSYGSEIVVVNQGNNDLVSVSKAPESRTWKLKYEKKYIYHQ
ncbi:MAG: prepilin-type N-terminal cleavage/methylation domain-containing protein [Candidatus Omnitrophota bacterium]|nr:MAG: prepilin-type N-terminal cleavage/methylation domain-containing protein [Candidatus Omnitrophota bacterium]